MKKVLALVLAVCMLFSIAPAFADEAATTPLVVAISTLSQKFSPYFADTGYDQDVVAMTQISMMTTDRVGDIVWNALEGETRTYNGSDYFYNGVCDLTQTYDTEADVTTYTATLKEGVKFSDGVEVTADDIIFNYYVYLDPAYNGSTTLNSYKIQGLAAYRNQMPEDGLAQATPIADALVAAGAGYTVKEGDAFTQAQYDLYMAKCEELWQADAAAMVDYMFENYGAAYAEMILGVTADEIAANGWKGAFACALWGFGEAADGKLITTAGEYDMTQPLPEDVYYQACIAKYANDFAAYIAAGESEAGASTDAAYSAVLQQIAADLGVDMSAGVPNISGIKKTGKYSVEVKVDGFEAPAVYSILGLQIAPAHYYGDGTFNYEENNFGHPFGDLSAIQSKKDVPMGAGPYVFQKYENRVVYYTANEYYYNGAPEIKEFQYKETNSADVPTAVQTGTADGGEMSGTKANFEMLRGMNSNGEVVGDVITTYSVANLGYGYIGINADNVIVGTDPGSDASKNLRKALATIVAVCRDTSIDSYYGDAAAVINYPISTTSWAAPQPADEGYRIAFSADVQGNDIYTAAMSTEERYEAAKAAARGYLEAAGYTMVDGVATAAPEGARLSYEVVIPGDGIGDHPSFAVLTDAKAMLAEMGIELKINDPADSNVLWDGLDAGTIDMWCAAWGSTIDPDMYQIYFSGNIAGLGGSDSNHYHIQSAALDDMVIKARRSDDQAYRKEMYKACLEEIMDWAVEVPVYQRQNINIASSQRVDTTTVTPDVTTYWLWLAEVDTMKMLAK